ncbi:MAG: two-component system, response regulator YesN [Clostridiales bacterium]|jgi:YesN/AraC family two-component response regulator|nr:two-component system, response regulator YesN [Clostridiales bacterium]
MYKVVLIDDEEIIVEGLKKMIDWTGYNCEVCASAYDAASGRQAIIECAPHIVFTDIRMPDQSGLSMLAGLRSECPEMLVTVLTGYRDFNYAQEAIRLGVHRLLLKPSRMDEINEAMSSMTAILDGRASVNLSKSSQDPIDDERNEDTTTDASAIDSSIEKTNNANSYIVRRALNYIEENYSSHFSLQELADHCYVSQWHLSKLLNKHTGKKFYDLLNAARIDAARKLLRDKSMDYLSIAEIGEMTGYTDTGHFSRTFKRLEGMSANEYRNS